MADSNITQIRDKGKAGAVSELLVCADLLNRGYEVFRSVSQSCSCDIVAYKDSKYIAIEIRTGTVTYSGYIGYSWKDKDVDRSMVVAVVVRNDNNRIFYMDTKSRTPIDL